MKYFERNEAAIQEEKNILEREASQYGVNAPMLYLLAGSTMVRILPPFDHTGVFFARILKHRVRVGARTETFMCPTTKNLPCAVCDKGKELTDTRDQQKMDFAREQLRPRQQFLYNVLCQSGPANKKGETPEFGKVYVMEVGVMVHQKVIGLDQDPATGWADVTNPNTGVTLIMRRLGQGLDTKYEVNPHGQGRTSIFTELTARGIDPASLVLHVLPDVYTPPTPEKLAEVVSQLSPVATPAAAPSFGPMPTPQFQPQAPLTAPAQFQPPQPPVTQGPAYAAPTAQFVPPMTPPPQAVPPQAPQAPVAPRPVPPAIPAPPQR